MYEMRCGNEATKQFQIIEREIFDLRVEFVPYHDEDGNVSIVFYGF